MRKNAASQSVTVTINGTNTTGNDTAHSFTFVAGDTLDVSALSDAGSATIKIQIGIEVQYAL